jgi:hypothetical protein
MHATIQATHHATIQTSNALGTVCSFPSTDRHVCMRSFPETSGKQCGSQRWGQDSRPDTCACSATQDYSQTTQTWLHGLHGGLVPLATCTEHNSYVRCPGIFPETSRKRPGGPGVGAPGDEDGCTGRAREGAQDAGGLAAGWYYLARSLTAAWTATAPSGLEFETRDGSHSGAVATGRQGLDGAWTVGLCSLPEMPCVLLLLLALPQGSNPAHIAPPSRPFQTHPGSYSCTGRWHLAPASAGQQMPTASHLQLRFRVLALAPALRLPRPHLPGSCSSV